MSWFVVPVKPLGKAKSRLGSLVDDGRRVAAARAMLGHVLDVLGASPRCTGILVVTPDGDVARQARARGAEVLTTAGDRDLNSAVTAGCDHLFRNGETRAIVLHGDLPLIQPDDIAALTDSPPGELTLARCKDLRGTNAVVTDLPVRFAFSFGEGSHAAHVAAGRSAGLTVRTIDRPGLACDVDVPGDLVYLESLGTFAAPSSGGLPGGRLAPDQARALVGKSAGELSPRALQYTLEGFGRTVTYSPKVFLPLTQLCRDVCHYCTFAKRPKQLAGAYMRVGEVVEIARQGAAMGCKEALFTLGERPEDRYRDARAALDAMQCGSTLDYLERAARAVLEKTGLLPHLNPGCMSRDEMLRLRPVAASMGLMLESGSEALCKKGGAHFGSPDKEPRRRFETIRIAGELAIPFTTGLLVGIGETRADRVNDLLALRDIHDEYGHIQEIIVQNFRAKPGTLMAGAPDASLEELVWTIAAARLIFGAGMSIQAPPNLSPSDHAALLDAGINDWGGVSPLTSDFVNPEAPWPSLEALRASTENGGRHLVQRLTIYPSFARDLERWADPAMQDPIRRKIDGEGFAIEQAWRPGSAIEFPTIVASRAPVEAGFRAIVARGEAGEKLDIPDIERLFQARGRAFGLVCDAADRVRHRICGDEATYVVNRNINYTNICAYKCQFCAFSKGKTHDNLRGKPYVLDLQEIVRRAREARERGATEVCLQGGIHPAYTGETYIGISASIRDSLPDMHIHAFSPLEVWHGASTLGLSLRDFLKRLQASGLATLPGTAAEILSDDVRAVLCPDKIRTDEWIEVMRTAHEIGLRSTATIMFGHVDRYRHWARHLTIIRGIQKETGGFTEFVPLPFVAEYSPIALRKSSRSGPDARESILMHAVARLVFGDLLPNVQGSWVKLGPDGLRHALAAGVNDLGGTLMDETITRSAGGANGSEMSPERLCELARRAGRGARQRTTLYERAAA